MSTRTSFLAGLGCFLATACLGQARPELGLRLSFNAETNRYEVVARPTFSARNFSWGPSQVSVVLPADVVDQTLSIRSVHAGSWADNSVVYAPNSSLEGDFHGITSQGDKLDLVAGQEYVLFDFGLKPGYVANVRLFDPAKDPGSDRAGMKGGDFRSYMADERGTDYLTVDSQQAPLIIQAVDLLQAAEPAITAQVVAYPNPNTGGKFRLYLKGFDAKETVRVQLVNTSGAVLNAFSEKVETLSGREINAGSGLDGYLLLNLNREQTTQRFSQKIWFR